MSCVFNCVVLCLCVVLCTELCCSEYLIVLFCVFNCVVLCIELCVNVYCMYYCHRVSTQLQLTNISISIYTIRKRTNAARAAELSTDGHTSREKSVLPCIVGTETQRGAFY
jgi:hypothetical protein